MEELVKCKICRNWYNEETRKPFIIKCGHTFCKECIEIKEGVKCVICLGAEIYLEVENKILYDALNLIRPSDKIYYPPGKMKRDSSQSPAGGTNQRKSSPYDNIITIKLNEPRIRSNSSTRGYLNRRSEDNTVDQFNKANIRTYFPIGKEKQDHNEIANNSIETIPLTDDKSVFDQSFSDYFPELAKTHTTNKVKEKEEEEEKVLQKEKKHSNNALISVANGGSNEKMMSPMKKYKQDDMQSLAKLKEQIYKSTSSPEQRKRFEENLSLGLKSSLISDNISKVQIKIDNEFFYIGQISKHATVKGVMFYSTGDYYEGDLFNNKREGSGIFIYKNGTKYEGTFKNNKPSGYGKLTQPDGEIYIGQWTDGRINGNGVRYHANGDKYSGQYVNNVRCGIGSYTFSNGDLYEGVWANGKANGKGKFLFANGNLYEGEFVDNQISGKGVFTFTNGDVYKGIFRNGLLIGQGFFRNIKGESYQGEFVNGKRNGFGNFFNLEGVVISSGYWQNDVFVGKKIN